jgi:mycothiol synthase
VSLDLSVPDLADAAALERFNAVATAAATVDGYRPFNEQAMLDLAAGLRTPLLISRQGAPVGAALLGRGELDLVIVPAHRGLGHAGTALQDILADAPDQLTAWSHGDHPAARVLANRHRFAAARTLLQLRKSLAGESDAASAPAGAPSQEVSIEAFRPGADDADWVLLNALVFAQHPEQGSLTGEDLAARQAEPWFDPADFLVARDRTGRMIGYIWLKIEAGSPVGEIYVIGVHPDAAGQGLGRALVRAGLELLRERGCTSAALYVEAQNAPAVHLYRSLGFSDFTIDVQYLRLAG